jgi:type III secretion protein Q
MIAYDLAPGVDIHEAPQSSTVAVMPYQPMVRISSPMATLANTLSRRRIPWSGRLRERPLSITILGFRLEGSDRSDEKCFDLVWAVGVERVILRLSRELMCAVIASIQPELGIPEEPTCSLLVEFALAPALSFLEPLCGMTIRLIEIRPASADDKVGSVLDLQVTLGRNGDAAQLFLPTSRDGSVPAFSDRIASLAATLAPQLRDLSEKMPIIVAGRAGIACLSASDLESLRPGDIILLGDSPLAQKRISLVVGNRYSAPAEVRATTAHLLAGFRPGLAPFLELQAMMATTRPPDVSLDDVEVKLTFEIGRWELPLSDLRSIGEGHVFELGRDLMGPIDILANGGRIGQGEVVRIGDTLGVRLVRLFV